MMVNTTVRALMADMENLWAGLDEVFASFGLADWARPHGPLWTMADVPFHLSYFDRDVIAHALDRGPDMPESDPRAHRLLRRHRRLERDEVW